MPVGEGDGVADPLVGDLVDHRRGGRRARRVEGAGLGLERVADACVVDDQAGRGEGVGPEEPLAEGDDLGKCRPGGGRRAGGGVGEGPDRDGAPVERGRRRLVHVELPDRDHRQVGGHRVARVPAPGRLRGALVAADEVAVGGHLVAGRHRDRVAEAGLVAGGVVGGQPGHRAHRLAQGHRPVGGAHPALGAAVGVGVLGRLALPRHRDGEPAPLHRLGGGDDQLVRARTPVPRRDPVDEHLGDARPGEVEVEGVEGPRGPRPHHHPGRGAVGHRLVVHGHVVDPHLVAAVALLGEERVARGPGRRRCAGQQRHPRPEREGERRGQARATAREGGHGRSVRPEGPAGLPHDSVDACQLLALPWPASHRSGPSRSAPPLPREAPCPHRPCRPPPSSAPASAG